MAETDTDTTAAATPTVDPESFESVRDQFQFTGFTDEQKETILDQLEQVWGTETGRDMLQDGLADKGFHYKNVNSQDVIEDFGGSRTGTWAVGGRAIQGNFALSSTGEVFLNGYDSIDPTTGTLEVYTNPLLAGQTAAADTPIQSLDENGAVFSVPPIYTMIHETGHVSGTSAKPDLKGNNSSAGRYHAGPTITDGTTAADYIGPNEARVRDILDELHEQYPNQGFDQHRGAYTGSWLNGRNVGEDYGLGRDHDVAITPSKNIDMSGHAPVDTVLVSTASGGAQTIRVGDADDTVHAFNGNDTVYTNGGEDRIFLGAGNDTAHIGWGSKTIDGGEANLDPTSDHRSDTKTDWGFDTVDYTSLPTGFASPDALQADSTFDGVARDGVLITMDGADISVNKGQENSVRVGEDVDTFNNIDAVKGSNRDDMAEVTSLSGNRVLDGAAGTDTLRIDILSDDSTLTHNPGPVTFNGVTYDGVITDGTNNTYYKDFENVVPFEAATAANDSPVEAPIIPPVDASLEGAPSHTLQMEDAVRILHEEGAEAAEMERAAGIEDGPVSNLINTPAGVSVMEELVANGDRSLEVDVASLEGDAYSRVSSVLRSSMERIEELDKVEEVEARNAEHLEQAAEVDVAVHQMPLAHEVQSAEADMDYDYAL